MIDYYDGKMTDIMPDSLKHGPEVQAMAHAVSNTLKKLLDASWKSKIYASIDLLDETVIDLLAVELRTKYYGGWLTLEEKREIVKKTLLWYCKAGTLYAVQELADFVFQDAKVEEWFQYGGGAYLFRIMIQVISQDVSLEKLLQFIGSIYEVKNTRSHLEAVIYICHKETEVKTVAAGGVGICIKIKTRTVCRIGAEADEAPAPALFLNQNILIKAEDEIKEEDVYILSERGGKMRVLTDNGCVVKMGQEEGGKEGE